METTRDVIIGKDFFIEETNELVIKNGIALRDLKEGEIIVSYGEVL